MWQDLREHLETIGILLAFVTAITAGYVRFTPTRMIEENHRRLVDATHWARERSWLRLMQSGIRWVLGLLRWLYGPPHGAGDGLSDYLTVRAWKMSAWFATFVLFAILPLGTSFIFYFGHLFEQLKKNEVNWENVAKPGTALVLFTVIFTVPFILTWRSIRKEENIYNNFSIIDVNFNIEYVIYRATKLSAMITLAALLPICFAALEEFSVYNNRPQIVNFILLFFLIIVFYFLSSGLSVR